MIVYGDSAYEETLPTLLKYLRLGIELSGGSGLSHAQSLNRLRQLLIFAGQIQQAVEDDAEDVLRPYTEAWVGERPLTPEEMPREWKSAPAAQQWILQARRMTEALADAFMALAASVCYGMTVTDWKPEYVVWESDGQADAGATLKALVAAVPAWETAPDIRLTVKIPEGFAFYTLYPEQYGAATLKWLAECPDEIPTVLVVGVRSIGTSLAAVAASALSFGGGLPFCITVRPAGHPYQRQASVPKIHVSQKQRALVADEGPGQSGSSMAAVAQALVEAGMPRERIAFLPGHGGEPGGHGEANVKAWWATAPRYVTPLSDMRWNGLSLPDALAAQTPRRLKEFVEDKRYASIDIEAAYGKGIDENAEVVAVEDFGGGLWRSAVYRDAQEWPAVCAAFERPKYRVTLADGTRVLWKFAGLATVPYVTNHLLSWTATREGWLDQAAMMELWLHFRAIIMRGVPPAPLGTALGFVATLWIEGTPLTAADAMPAVLTHLGSYIAACSAPPLTDAEHDAAMTRLTAMLYWNTWEALGEAAAEQTRAWSERMRQSAWVKRARAFGDGRLAPHKWIRTRTGGLYKADCIGYETDHTIIGRQAWAWDVAGALIEWKLTEEGAGLLAEAARQLLQGLPGPQASSATIPPDILTAYQMAYAAFRVGQTSLCAHISAYDPDEQARLWRAQAYYTDRLARLLPISPAAVDLEPSARD